MFSSALKSFASSNITSNYSISQSVTSTAGPWKIYDCKKKSTGKAYSLFVFDKKSLDSHGNSLGRSGASAFKRAAEEVVERLRKEASSLAKLRHPSVLELVEPVEDTRGGGLQFVTEAVTASLASLLQEKDDQERGGGVGGRSGRYVTEDADGVRRRREFEIDELEIQKGLLQISKALEFLHDNAALVHGNLTPDAILINAKSDWKISGLAFCSPPENSNKATSFQPVSLGEILNLDPRLPRFVQLNLDYTSPDFVLDNNLTAAADMFSLGLLCIALYNYPHRSPLEAHGSLSTYKRLFSSSSTVPSSSNGYLSSRTLPRDLSAHVLPRLITRRPAQRMGAREFQDSEYFDNILVSTIRFLDSFPAKTPNEKAQFMRGLNKVLPSFPKAVTEKKLLPALLEEMKDKDLISLILQNVFKIIELLPAPKRPFGERVRPVLKQTFVSAGKKENEPQRDPAKDAGLMVVLENMPLVTGNCGGKEFTDDILPIIMAAVESTTPAVVDAALRGLPSVLPVLDFSTIKNELFPVIAMVFGKTSSLAIKVRGCQAFVVLCGGSNDALNGGLNDLGIPKKKPSSSSSALDKYTMQEKIIPLIKAIKTKEPAVMMAALDVLRVVGEVADADFVAMEILPILWSMSLGPLLNLKQFRSFMELVKSLSGRVEEEQSRKLQELNTHTNGTMGGGSDDLLAFGGVTGTSFDASNTATENDFEQLVKGKGGSGRTSTVADGFSSWDETPASGGANANVSVVGRISTGSGSRSNTPKAAAFSWSTPSLTQTQAQPSQLGALKPQAQPGFRTVTPDLAAFPSIQPGTTQFSQPLQPMTQQKTGPSPGSSTSIHWSSTGTAAAAASSNPWASTGSSSTVNTGSGSGGVSMAMGGMTLGGQRPGMASSQSSFSLPPPPSGSTALNSSKPMASSGLSGFSLPPPTSQPASGMMAGPMMSSTNRQTSATGTGVGTGTGTGTGMGLGMGMGSSGSMNSFMTQQQNQQGQGQGQTQKSGLDKYQSLI
ncbi:ARM repeat-containing protein [Sodiomyces alkalinus F11]|uniref:ARM repeat-containing protein n=1 Tax=Sodiomyces alkalinus (strain CBS 110278 / VKM F-3762 / F11) TaxID=1314773 RepID=A0A3N2PK03_SODAK|nr:ARM repeat-containing protein [Sodiomyces alkalinus F11]ROT34851.1 ARM repeat-containing protein [Sodiomyces alkalinus F11]